jgi:hypothetical protein
MSSYLNQLAARTLEQPPPIRPRLASLFEPVPGPRVRRIETSVSRRLPSARNTDPPREVASTNLDPVPVTSPRPIDRSASQITSEHRAVTEPVDLHAPARAEAKLSPRSDPQPPALAARPVTKRAAETARFKSLELPADRSLTNQKQNVDRNLTRIDPAPPVIPNMSLLVRNETYVTERAADSLATDLADEAVEPIAPNQPSARTLTVTPVLTVNPDLPSDPEPVTPDASGAIRITIGRVEVRAIMPPPPAPAPARSTAAPNSALSLDEYLKQRSGQR